MQSRSLRDLVFVVTLSIACLSTTAWGQTLEGLAVLPADTFAPGPTSGQFIAPANGRIPPFFRDGDHGAHCKLVP